MTDESAQPNQIITTLKTYCKLCSKSSHRAIVLADKNFLGMLSAFLTLDDKQVVVYLVKILLYLTEEKEDAKMMAQVPGLEAAVGSAAERDFPLAVLKNLLIISSRLQVSKTQKFEQGDSKEAVKDGSGTISRRFVSKKSKQLIFQFEELENDLRHEIERIILTKKGVISVYFNMDTKRVIVRTTLAVEAQEIADVLFDCGCEVVSQIVKIDGVEEIFHMYASEREEKTKIALPGYIDDELEVMDPNSCVVTNEYSKNQSGGWFSSITSLVRGSLW